jgi:H+/Cl- antiporter ClcA
VIRVINNYRLSFVADPNQGLFGMNVNILADNPPWWWYLVFMFLTLSLTMLVWLTCRKFPDVSGCDVSLSSPHYANGFRQLEDKVNEKFPWLKPDRARQKFGPVE